MRAGSGWEDITSILPGSNKDCIRVDDYGTYVAIKILKKSELIKLKQVDHILNEIKILSLIDHPFLVHTDGFNQDKKYLDVVLELVNGGELFTYLRGVGKFPPEQAW